jgi:nitrogen fixation NifU-like protein
MSELRELYQEVILEHSKKPKNFRALESANHKAEGFNPLCGDHFTVYVDVKDGSISDIGFQAMGRIWASWRCSPGFQSSPCG